MVDYATLAQVRQYANYRVDDTDDDTEIGDLITRVSRRFDTITGRTFAPDADSTKYFRYEDHVKGYDLWLGDEDDQLLSVTTLTNADGNTIASSEYFLLPRNGSRYHTVRLKEASTYSWEDDTDGYISIAGRWGWSSTVPDDLRLACIEAVVYILKGRKNIADYERPRISQDGTMLLPKSLPQRVWDTLTYYKKRS